MLSLTIFLLLTLFGLPIFLCVIPFNNHPFYLRVILTFILNLYLQSNLYTFVLYHLSFVLSFSNCVSLKFFSIPSILSVAFSVANRLPHGFLVFDDAKLQLFAYTNKLSCVFIA